MPVSSACRLRHAVAPRFFRAAFAASCAAALSASPAAVDRSIYLRTDRGPYRIETP